MPERPKQANVKAVILPPVRRNHIKLQKRIEKLLEAAAGERGVIATGSPYRPVPNLQYLGRGLGVWAAERLGRAAAH